MNTIATRVVLALREVTQWATPGVPMAGGRRSDLVVRVSAILAERAARGRVGRRAAVAITLFAAGLVLVISPLRAARALEPVPVAVLQAPAPVQAGRGPSFEVASVKRSADPDGPRSFGYSPGRVWMTNQTVRQMITSSYQIQDYQLLGGPDWLASELYDVEARTAGTPDPFVMLTMVRSLLAERFALAMRAERRTQPVFRLVHARPNRRPGPGLQTSVCQPGGPDAAVGQVTCGNQVGCGAMTLRGTTMRALANQLGRQAVVGRPVVDATGMDGRFDIQFTWTPDPLQRLGQGDAVLSAVPAETVSIFTALREQLGLEPQTDTGAVDVLVIEGVERLTAN